MATDEKQAKEKAEEGIAIAEALIAAEKTARTGRLNLGNLGLTRLPPSLWELDWLEDLQLGGVIQYHGTVYRRLGNGSLKQSNEVYHPNRLDDIVPSLGRLSQLRHLDWGADLSDISPLSGLTALQSLDCSYTQVADLTPLAGLTALQSLDLTETQVADLTPLAGLTALQSLNLMGTPVEDLTPLSGLTALQSLDCSYTQVADLTPLNGLTALQSLKLMDTQVADLTPLAGLTALQSLNCSYTQVADLTPLAGLTALQSLDLVCTPVTDLTPLAGLTALQSLNLMGNQVANLTPLNGLTALQSLDLVCTPVTDLTPLAGLTALQSLNLIGTQVASLTPLNGLTALQSLNLMDTQVADLTPLAGLTALQSLDLWGTAVQGLSESIVGLSGLQKLVINAQPGLSDLPGEVLSQDSTDNCLARLRSHLTDLSTGSEPLRDVKVIVLGNGRIGKTQICRRLRGEPFETDANSTHGISVTSRPLVLPPGYESAVLNLWDFGGQDIYHGTHALFMRTRAVFLLVWTPESECGKHEYGGMVFRNQPLIYWLEYIRHLGGDKSPVILVQTRCDNGLGECLNLPVENAFSQPLLTDGRFFTRVAYSAQDDSGRAHLTEALQRAVIQLRVVQGQPRIGRNRLAVWNQLRTWRDTDAQQPEQTTRRHRLLSYSKFESLCAKRGVHAPKTFAEVLHHAGMVFYRPDLFNDHMVLDQSWALDAVYAVFTRANAVHKHLCQLNGRFTQSLLHILLWQQRGLSAQDQHSLLGMMEASGICFAHRRGNHNQEETEYVAPDLLPEGGSGEPPPALADMVAARWASITSAPLEASFRYPFLSPAIGRALLSALGTLAGTTAIYWRYGLCLYDAASKANAIIDAVADADNATNSTQQPSPSYGGRVRIRVKGDGAERLLTTLIKHLDDRNKQGGWAGGEWLHAGGAMSVREAPRTVVEQIPPLRPADPPPIPPAIQEVYVSYAWKQEYAQPLIDELIEGLAQHGTKVLRDRDELQPGDRISEFMKRLTTGRCVLLVISEDYLRSPACMTELHGIWVNARQREETFLKRIVPLVQENAHISKPQERIGHAGYWKQEYTELDELIHQHGADVLGINDLQHFQRIGDFYRHIGDMLSFANDKLVPRDRPTLSRDHFAVVQELICRALE